MPTWLETPLRLLPYLYLGLAVLFAATGAGFIICQYDPFVGFFRFSATFNIIIFGLFLLLLGTVVARPYCRYLCPLSVLLNWFSRVSRKHVNITPSECNLCRLCEESCPFEAINMPVVESGQKSQKECSGFHNQRCTCPYYCCWMWMGGLKHAYTFVSPTSHSIPCR